MIPDTGYMPSAVCGARRLFHPKAVLSKIVPWYQFVLHRNVRKPTHDVREAYRTSYGRQPPEITVPHAVKTQKLLHPRSFILVSVSTLCVDAAGIFNFPHTAKQPNPTISYFLPSRSNRPMILRTSHINQRFHCTR